MSLTQQSRRIRRARLRSGGWIVAVTLLVGLIAATTAIAAPSSVRLGAVPVATVANDRGQAVVVSSDASRRLFAQEVFRDGRSGAAVGLGLRAPDAFGEPPVAALGDDGRLIVAALRYDASRPPEPSIPSNPDVGCCDRVRLVSWRIGKRRSRVRTVSPRGGDASSVRVATGHRGRAWAVWTFTPDEGSSRRGGVQGVSVHDPSHVVNNGALSGASLVGADVLGDGTLVVTVRRSDTRQTTLEQMMGASLAALDAPVVLVQGGVEAFRDVRLAVEPGGRQFLLHWGPGLVVRGALGRVGQPLGTLRVLARQIYGVSFGEASVAVARDGTGIFGIRPRERVDRSVLIVANRRGGLIRRDVRGIGRGSQAPQVATRRGHPRVVAFTSIGAHRRSRVEFGRLDHADRVQRPRVLSRDQARGKSCSLLQLTGAGPAKPVVTWGCFTPHTNRASYYVARLRV